jgi:DNA modification methylase
MHKIIFGNSADMREVADGSVHLIVTSPPYFNAPFDYPDLFTTYDDYLAFMRQVCAEIKRVLAEGRIACIVCDDILLDGVRYPVVADLLRIFVDEGFTYRDRIVWVKPEGYIRISRRSGVVLQHPYPMYFYPDNVQESILIFQKSKFDYRRAIPESKEDSRLDIKEYQQEKWYLNVWRITNVLPLANRLEEGIAAFPDEIAYRLIKLFSYAGETVLDPFLGSGTTSRVARRLGRSSVGYEIDLELLPVIKQKVGFDIRSLGEEVEFEVITRDDARRLRSDLQQKVGTRKSVAANAQNKAKKV